MNIGERIRNIRLINNIKSNELASILGITDVYMSYIEGGKRTPSFDIIEKICSALGITLKEFFDDGSEPMLLTPELKELIESARDLSPDQIIRLNEFLKSIK